MIAVVGGGITGLALGRELDRRGLDVLVLEASVRPGGVIRSATVAGRILDWGPQRVRLTPRLSRLVDDVGLTDELVTAPSDLDLHIYREGRLCAVPFSVGRFLFSDVVSLRARLRALLEPLSRGPDPEERVDAFFRRKFGDELYETLIAPLYGGLYGSDPADMVVGLSLLPVLREFGVRRSLLLRFLRRGGTIRAAPPATFRTGMQALPNALAAALGDRFRAEAPVRSLRPDGSRWRLELPDDVIDAEAVVLTTPAHVTSSLLTRAAPEQSSAIGGLRYNPLAIVHLDAETRLRGLGFQVAFTERDLSLRGVTFNDSLFGRENLYTAYLGGAHRPEVIDLKDDELASLARREFRACTGYEARVLSVGRERMPAWDVTWNAIRNLTLPDGLHIAANWRSRPGLLGRLADADRVTRVMGTMEARRAA